MKIEVPGNHQEAAYCARQWLKAIPGYPFLPCPICRGIEGCDHPVPMRARATHPGLQPLTAPNP